MIFILVTFRMHTLDDESTQRLACGEYVYFN